MTIKAGTDQGTGENNMYRLFVAIVAVTAMLALPAWAQPPQPWTQIGSLTCKVDPSVGFIIAGHQPMQCTYTPTLAPAPPQYYDGAINTIGLISASAPAAFWPGAFSRRRPGFLTGHSPASMSAHQAISDLASAPAPMSWSEAPREPSRCSPSRFKALSPSMPC